MPGASDGVGYDCKGIAPREVLRMMEPFCVLTVVVVTGIHTCVKTDRTATPPKITIAVWLKGLSGREQKLEKEVKTEL